MRWGGCRETAHHELNLTLADIDPTAIGDSLAQAQTAQDVLAICVAVLLSFVVALLTFYVLRFSGLLQWVKDLHEWHNNRDGDGVLSWMVPRAWGDKLDALKESGRTEQEGIRELREAVDRLAASHGELREELRKIEVAGAAERKADKEKNAEVWDRLVSVLERQAEGE